MSFEFPKDKNEIIVFCVSVGILDERQLFLLVLTSWFSSGRVNLF